MERGNDTPISEFLLLGFSDEPALQPLIFGIFISMYLTTVLGNLLIIMAVISDLHLHTPMYFFLSNLSLVDICFPSTTIPKMLVNILTQSKSITYAGCITQMYFFLLFAGLDDILLTVMAYDRFVAICHPLHYMVIMNPRLCGLLLLVSWIMIVFLFYGTVLGVYLSSAATHSSNSSAAASVMYAVVTPMLNPFIYSLRNKDIKRALRRFYGMAGTKGTIILRGTRTAAPHIWLFLSMYLITVLGNLPIILAFSSDSHLHTPMYFFLSNLSLVDIGFTSTTVPKMLVNIKTQSKVISNEGCITQIYFLMLFGGWDNILLTVMAYDRYVAICHPLHYTVIMNPQLCGLLVLVSWITTVSLFYCTILGVYLSSAPIHTSQSSSIISVMYTMNRASVSLTNHPGSNSDFYKEPFLSETHPGLDDFLLAVMAYDRLPRVPTDKSQSKTGVY
ncbi:hypothetical protein QTO34_015368 [Cnephaeus nilssonii]|uniref:G-protein coupled receptors family 1 profile domain-containing protein n=1 Tax=Cnephaeus nilssonii TaxID=3371016 RepID=A0AA40LSQ2_CNENI|nr:hypothetical protein QTO34_015368 [Eptesicus nilssonii]